ncbi:amidase [Chelativorans sp. Marseille-P2723]|uniref:amidase n=1 Tax=Chelativorans sp. Marseille-P2723 TaxID=2709133 RepID=UPI00156EFCDC|nr:amidase [Chelativorans sp. Marseille-P2723]
MAMKTDLQRLGLADLRDGLAKGWWSSRDIAEAYLARIAALNPQLNAFALVMADEALADAEAADARRAKGESLGTLDGLPIAVKDVCDIAGTPTGAGVKAWANRIAQSTAPVIERLRSKGMVILGKTNMVELALGGWGTNPFIGTPLNPWDRSEPRAPGGSSSGSAVAVAAGLVPVALGSDTGGSVRLPASFNGLSGMKTTPGLIPITGTFPLTAHLDTIGFLARRISDVIEITDAVSEPGAPVLAAKPFPEGKEPLAGLQLAMIRDEDLPGEVDRAVREAVAQAAETLRSLGAVVEEVAPPFDFAELLAANGRIILYDAWRLYQAHVEDLDTPCDPAVRERLFMAREISEADYNHALEQRDRACAEWAAWVAHWPGGLLLPCTPTPAPTLRSLASGWSSCALLTAAGNFVDAATMSLPIGFTSEGLPIGAQLMGPAWSEWRLAAIGDVFQRVTDWHLRCPYRT